MRGLSEREGLLRKHKDLSSNLSIYVRVHPPVAPALWSVETWGLLWLPGHQPSSSSSERPGHQGARPTVVERDT